MTRGGDTGHLTLADVVNAASDLLRDVEAGTLRCADVQTRAVAACGELFGIVGSGPNDAALELHRDVTRQYLGAGGLSANELAEWLPVQKRREQSGNT